MRMHVFALAAALALATLGSAGELDREFKAGDAKGAVSTPTAMPEPASKVSTGTELDDESPTQAHRRGWGGGWGGWGGGHGWGGYHYGGGYYHGGWGYGHVGYHRSYYGFYGVGSYGPSYYYRPYSYYQPVYAYSYYPSYVYASYGYPGGGYYGW